MRTQFTTPTGRVIFQSVFAKTSGDKAFKPKHSLCLLFKKGTEAHKILKQQFRQFLFEEGLSAEITKKKDFKMCIKDCSTIDKYKDDYSDYVVLEMSTEYSVVKEDIDGELIVPIEDEDGAITNAGQKIYNGCYCIALYGFYPYSIAGNSGVGAFLIGVQKEADGDEIEKNIVVEFKKPVYEEDDLDVKLALNKSKKYAVTEQVKAINSAVQTKYAPVHEPPSGKDDFEEDVVPF